jgi:hypothetical protein
MTDTALLAFRVNDARRLLAAFREDHGTLCARRGQRARSDYPMPATVAANVAAQIAADRRQIDHYIAVRRENIPACDMPDGCGAAAGTACATGCPSRATDEYDALLPAT